MGEPSLNPAVLDVLDELPDRYHAPGLMPSISTVAPAGAQRFFEQLIDIKQSKYSGGRFQFQFSLHTTDDSLRDEIIPVKKWRFDEMAAYGERFFLPGDRKITLNFALAHGAPVDPDVLRQHFDPGKFLIKITPQSDLSRSAEQAHPILTPTGKVRAMKSLTLCGPLATKSLSALGKSRRTASAATVVNISGLIWVLMHRLMMVTLTSSRSAVRRGRVDPP
jgi:hypothetical protein